MIVVDVGCGRYGGDYSAERLVEWYHPSDYHGFDPNHEALADAMATATPVPGTTMHWHAEAAWIADGTIAFFPDGLASHVGEGSAEVACIDLARFIEHLPEGPVVLKLDAEGAEYELMEHLIDGGTIARLTRIIIEWHARDEGKRRRAIEQGMRRAGVVWEQWRW